MCWCPCGSRRSRDLHIESLRVSRFRNIEQLDLSPSPCLTVVTGANGQGKTSLLEALYVLGTGGSFRTGNDAEMVQKGREGYYIASCYDRGGRSLECSLAYDALSGSKQFCINQKKAAFNDDKRLNLGTPAARSGSRCRAGRTQCPSPPPSRSAVPPSTSPWRTTPTWWRRT